MGTDITGLVIGYGSIGRRHAQVLSTLTSSIAIVNRRESVRRQAAQDHPRARIAERLAALDGEGFPWESTIAVIATWGPSHASLFGELADRGVRYVLCEKPLAASVGLADAMVRRAESQQIVLAVNHDVRFARLAPALRAFAAARELGAPVAVVVEGGAACLVTNGIHWIDFAAELFGAEPEQVISTVYGEAINPRAPDLGFYGGTAIWRFSDQREAVITLSNRSSVEPTVRVYFRDAVAEIEYVSTEAGLYLNAVIRRRDWAAVARFPAVTRTGPVVDEIFAGRLPEVRTFSEGMQAAVREVLEGDVRTCSGYVGAKAVSFCIGALIAAREGRAVTLPIDPASSWGQAVWPIS